MSTSSLTLPTQGAQSSSASASSSSQPDYTPYLSETTYPLPHIAHLSPIEIFQLNRFAESASSPAQKDHCTRRRVSLAGRVGMRLSLRLPSPLPPFPRPPPPRIIEAAPPDLTLIPIPIDAVLSLSPHLSRTQPHVTFGVDGDVAAPSCTPRRPRKCSASPPQATSSGKYNARRGSIELLHFPPWKGKGKLQAPDVEHLAVMAAQALTRTDSRLSATSDIAFAPPNAAGGIGRYQKTTGFRNRNPNEDADPIPAFPVQHDAHDTRIFTPSNRGSKLARMLGGDAHPTAAPVRGPSPNLRLDTRFLDAGTPRVQPATRSQESLTLAVGPYPYLDAPHTHPDLGALPTDTPPSTPVVFQHPPVADVDVAAALDDDEDMLPSDSDAPGLQRRGTTTPTVRVRRERFSYILTPMEPGPISAPPLEPDSHHSKSKSRVFRAFGVNGAGEWTGEWNQVEMQEVIRQLRGLKLGL
ncbi:hypothetical protein FB45DRAFT_906439 [Roridomyces roridus]|uniref:Uncharacterized protein n=1 Tax=Roridomyces roridus TaxID=1738132 RepID=A0AAD7C0Z7_9AGAR|nr:hypothetical protein FB45DRAFT_906439 [Roridomyces roridus]